MRAYVHREPTLVVCDVDGCSMAVVERIWCTSHFLKWWRTGSPVGVIDPRLASTRGVAKRRTAG